MNRMAKRREKVKGCNNKIIFGSPPKFIFISWYICKTIVKMTVKGTGGKVEGWGNHILYGLRNHQNDWSKLI